MAYNAFIDTEFYKTYKGAAIDESVFDRIALRASDEVDRLSFGRIRQEGIESFNSKTQEAIKIATCHIAEALAQIDTATDGTGIAAGSEKVGSYSYTMEAASLSDLKEKAIRQARHQLFLAGLRYAGI